MCDFNQGFILCKCEEGSSKKEQEGKAYSWTLCQYLGKNTSDIVGKYRVPVSDLGKGLTAEFVEAELNRHNCFDFDYQPSEGDSLIINTEDNGERLEFIFRGNVWKEDHYSPFADNYKEMTKGILKSN